MDSEDKTMNWNNLQFFDLRPMTSCFYDLISVQSLLNFNKEFESHAPTHKVFKNIALLYVTNILLRDGWFFRGILSSIQVEALQTQFNSLLKELRPEIIRVTHAFPFTDQMLGMLGHKDENVYDNVLATIKKVPNVTSRDPNWRKFYNKAI